MDLGADLEPVLEDVRDGKFSVYIRPELTRQEIVFNLDPLASRQTFSPQKMQELRTVIAQGIDRNSINRQVFYGQSEIPSGFYPRDHAEYNSGSEALPYDPEAAGKTLETMGWTWPDDDPEGIRIASKVPGVMYGT